MILEFTITRNILGSSEKLWNHKYWVQFWKDKLSIADIIFLHKLAFLIHKKKKCFYSPKYFVKMWFWSFSSLILDFGGKILNHYFYDHLGLIFFSIEDILFYFFLPGHKFRDKSCNWGPWFFPHTKYIDTFLVSIILLVRMIFNSWFSFNWIIKLNFLVDWPFMYIRHFFWGKDVVTNITFLMLICVACCFVPSCDEMIYLCV